MQTQNRHTEQKHYVNQSCLENNKNNNNNHDNGTAYEKTLAMSSYNIVGVVINFIKNEIQKNNKTTQTIK